MPTPAGRSGTLPTAAVAAITDARSEAGGAAGDVAGGAEAPIPLAAWASAPEARSAGTGTADIADRDAACMRPTRTPSAMTTSATPGARMSANVPAHDGSCRRTGSAAGVSSTSGGGTSWAPHPGHGPRRPTAASVVVTTRPHRSQAKLIMASCRIGPQFERMTSLCTRKADHRFPSHLPPTPSQDRGVVVVDGWIPRTKRRSGRSHGRQSIWLGCRGMPAS